MLNHLVLFLNSENLTLEQLNRGHVNESFLKKLSTYFARDAIKLTKKANATDPDEKISLSSAQHFLSQFKNYFLCRFGRCPLVCHLTIGEHSWP